MCASRSQVVHDLSERGYVARAVLAVQQQGTDSRRPRSVAVLLRGVADVQRLGRLASGQLQGGGEDPGLGFARPGLGR